MMALKDQTRLTGIIETKASPMVQRSSLSMPTAIFHGFGKDPAQACKENPLIRPRWTRDGKFLSRA
jgi:hypothetical protein